MYNQNMTRHVLFFILGITCITQNADAGLLFGGGTRNAFTLRMAQGTGSGTLFKLIDPFQWEIGPQTMLVASYSQPIALLRMPGRINIDLVQNFGYRSSDGLSFTGVGISWDVALLQWRGFYFGIGIGPYMRDVRDRWVDSRLVFGEKVFIGKILSNRWRAEFFTMHFSNGNFTDKNEGFNFAGLGINYSF